jgi:ring-1,2-phenylacetyl-CoA epoxidase subunit PaaC
MSLLHYVLHLADNALVLGQRNAEWCGHGPVLEEDIAMANLSLDLIGQSRMLYQYAAELMTPTLPATHGALPQSGEGAPDSPERGAFAARGGPSPLTETPTEDRLAYFRDAPEFRNYTMLELPHNTAFAPSASVERDYAVTITRNFLYASLMSLVWQGLTHSKDERLAAIAGKAIKEVRYHLRHSTDWMLRLGDGTSESRARMQAALDHLMPYTQEWFTTNDVERDMMEANIGVNVAALKEAWQTAVATVVTEATLEMPPATGHLSRGKDGLHSEHLSYLLAEMQSLARAHPQATW